MRRHLGMLWRGVNIPMLAGALLLPCCAAFADDKSPAPDAPVVVRASANPDHVTIGDPIRYIVEISAAPDTEVIIPVLSGQLGDFTISDFGELPARREKERVINTRWYTLTAFITGDRLIPPAHVQYRTPGEALQDATGNEVLVGVASLLAQDANATDIRDIAPPEALPFDWRPYGVVAAVLAAVGLLAGAFWYFVTRPRRQPVVPPRPAHEVALAALDRLRAQHLTAEGRFEEYFVQLSAIVRRYLEDRFSVRAPEMTTEEFLAAAASNSRLIAAHRRLLAEFLSQADLVKFARHLPTLADSEAAYTAARRFVDESRPGAPLGGPAQVQHAAA